MGLFANVAEQVKEKDDGKFKPLDLNEINVQALFNRCLATKDSSKIMGVTLFSKRERIF